MRHLLLAIVLGLTSAIAHSATLTVTNLDDSGPGSLRAAIEQVNELASTTSILSYRIEFETGESNYIWLQTPLPPINGQFVTLVGEGMRVTGIF